MNRPLRWMGALFVVLLSVIALVRSRTGDDAGEASPRVEAERIRSFWATYHRATEARLAEDYQTAARTYRDALAIDPKHQDSLFYLATSLEASAKYRGAAKVLKELTSLYPEHSRAWSQLGTVLATKAPGAAPDLDGAEAAFRRAQEINSEHTGPFLRRGQLALERGRLDEARELFRIAADAGAPEGMYFSGLTAHLEGEPRSAKSFFQSVLDKAAQEARITGRGASAEGDVEAKLTALDRARIRAEWFLRPKTTDEEPFLRLGHGEVGGRGAFVDLDRDGDPSLVVASDFGEAWDVLPLDFNDDAWTDLYVIGSGYTGSGRNRLLVNEGGELHDVTEKWGLAGDRSTAAAVAADLDGDGKTDLLEVGASPLLLYLQRGGRFVLANRGLSHDAFAVDVDVADVDSDGNLDVFVLGWKAPGRLFRSNGTTFEDVTASAGLGEVGGDGFSALFFDFDNDRDPDLLVTSHAPLELSLRRSSYGPTPRLFENDGRGGFSEVTSDVGLDQSLGIMQALAADLDSDGYLDLAFALGGLDAAHLEPSVVLRNVEGREFQSWALLPSPDDPCRASGVAASETRLYLAGVGVFRRREP